MFGFPPGRGDGASLAQLMRGTGRGFASVDDLFLSARFVPVPYAATVTIDLATGRNFAVGALTGNLTLAFANAGLVEGWSGTVLLIQDGTGGRALSINGLGVSVLAPGGAAPAIDTTASRRTLIHWLALPSGLVRIGGEQVR